MACLPENYADDGMVALIRDPGNIFVYWDLENGVRAKLEARLGAAAMATGQWTLRIINLDTGAFSDLPIQIDARNWYAAVEPNSSYEVALGFVDDKGEFHGLLAQGPLLMPPLSYSHLYDKQWMILEEDYLRLLALGWGGFLGSSPSSTALIREMESAWITVSQEPEETQGAPTSPGVPQYKGRR